MKIKVYADNNIEDRESLAAHFKDEVEDTLSRISDHITRVEVHLSRENRLKLGKNARKTCMIEARLEGCKPIAVKHQDTTMEKAVDVAMEKLIRMITESRERQRDLKHHKIEKNENMRRLIIDEDD
ncbi:MAG: HPF/RaiA family ribosome-associated protein [Fibrobacteria bacterium]|nr:HPF/RaiA family ribosome-associated protein [Fibrobacteria bacterium]